MPYVERRGGAVIGVYAQPQLGYAEESLPDGHPDLVAFANRPVVTRVTDLEALMAALIRKGHVSQSDIDDEKAR